MNPLGKRLSARYRRRWEVNVSTEANLTEIWNEDVDKIYLAVGREGRLVLSNTKMNSWVSRKAGNCLTRWATISFSRNTVFNGICQYEMSGYKRNITRT